MVILEGEAGIGKTRLAEDFLADARGKGTQVVAARCYEGETQLAYGPIITCLRTAIARRAHTGWLDQLAAPWL